MTRTPIPAPESSGVYRAPADVADLRVCVIESGGQWLEADLKAVRGKLALMDSVAQAARFPAHFGRNWDALADSLQDLAISPPAGCVLMLRGASCARQALGAEWKTLLEILADAAMYWKGRGIPFVVFVDGELELPEWR